MNLKALSMSQREPVAYKMLATRAQSPQIRCKLRLVPGVVRVPTLLTFSAGWATAQILLRGMQVELHGGLHNRFKFESEYRPIVR